MGMQHLTMTEISRIMLFSSILAWENNNRLQSRITSIFHWFWWLVGGAVFAPSRGKHQDVFFTWPRASVVNTKQLTVSYNFFERLLTPKRVQLVFSIVITHKLCARDVSNHLIFSFWKCTNAGPLKSANGMLLDSNSIFREKRCHQAGKVTQKYWIKLICHYSVWKKNQSSQLCLLGNNSHY